MKTEKSNANAKAEIIQKFAETLDKHCSSEQDVQTVIYSMLAMQQHMEKLLESRVTEVGYWIRSMREEVVKKDYRDNVRVFDCMTDGFIDALDVISHHSKGLEIISNLHDDLINSI